VARLRRNARLRGRQCVSLAELNAAIRELLEAFNGTVTQHPSSSRQELFETPDRPALKPLHAEPAEPYEDAEWVERRRARLDPEEQPVSSPARPARAFRRLWANTHRPMGGAGDHPSDHPLHSQVLDGMAEAFADLRGREDRGDFSHAEWLGRLIDREAASHSTKTFQTRMRAARLRHLGACSEDVDCRASASATGRRFRTSPPSGGSMSAATC